MTTFSRQVDTPSAADGRILRIAALSGIVAQVAFVTLWFVWGFLESDYDVARQDISDFGALDASHPVPYNIILSATGALTIVLAYGLYRVLRPGRTALAGSLAVAVIGAGDFLDGLLREDCSPSGNPACRAAADAGDLSWHHNAHDLESLVTIGSIIIAPLVLSFAFRKRLAWRGLVTYSALTAAVVFVLVAAYGTLFAANGGSAINGLLERAAATIGVAWLAVVAGRLWHLADGERGPLDPLAAD